MQVLQPLLEADLEPFKGLLLGLFFISVGAQIDFPLIARAPGTIAGEGPERDGLYVWEDAQYLELLDVDTGAPVAPPAGGAVSLDA